MSKINDKLGLKANTKTRAATHAPALASSMRCPCGSQHVLHTQSTNGKRSGDYWCGACGLFFSTARAA